MMRTAALVFAAISVLLGALWLLQGLGLVHLRPILCFADCATIQGPSFTWSVIGAIGIVVGGLAALWSRSRRPGAK